METVNFPTSLGVIPLTGPASAFGGSQAVVLTITGAFAEPDYLARAPLILGPGYDGFLASLPGNRTPTLSDTSIAGFARAFDEVVASFQRPILVLGISTGALVALAMKRPSRIVAVEPPLSTGKLWPLLPNLRPSLSTHGEFLDNVFGLTEAGVVDRSYHHLIDELSIPTDVVVGERPLYPERRCEKYPSLVDESERQLMAAHPLITMHVAPGAGHNVPLQAGRFLLEIQRRGAASI